MKTYSDISIRAPSATAEKLTKTNDVISHTDRSIYQHELSAITHRLVNIKREITEASEKIRTLQEESSLLTQYSQTYQKILHPIRILPAEVLRIIFLFCLNQVATLVPISLEATEHDSLDPTKPPWSLGQVCHRWRQVVLSSPSLWTSLQLHVPEPRETPPHLMGAMTRQLVSYLRRSGSHALTIVIISATVTNPGPNHPLLCVLYSHCSRWELLRLMLIADPKDGDGNLNLDVLYTMSCVVKADLPVLHTVEMFLAGKLARDEVIDAFEVAPRLRNLVVYCSLRGVGRSVRMKLPWGQIKRFYRKIAKENEVAVVTGTGEEPLAELTNVMHFYDTLRKTNWHDSAMEVHLSSLEMLVFWPSRCVALGLQTTLDYIETGDRLRDLRIPSLDIPSLPAFLACSGSNIQTIFFRDSDSLGVGGLSRLLKFLPSLTTLYVLEPRRGLIQCLARRDSDKLVLPRLSSLHFFGVVAKSLDEEEFLRMIRARVAGISPLRLLSAHKSAFSEEAWRRLRRLRELGLETRVQSKSCKWVDVVIQA